MKTGFPGGPRLMWYDRNPINRTLFYVGTDIGPHGITVRSTYTVGTGKKAFVGGCYGQSMRRTAAGTLSLVGILLNGIGAGAIFVWAEDNTVGHVQRANIDVQAVSLAAHILSIQTSDEGIGGTLNYSAQITIMEFDA